MKCSKCGSKLIQLFTSVVCDVCDPPAGAPAAKVSPELPYAYYRGTFREVDNYCKWIMAEAAKKLLKESTDNVSHKEHIKAATAFLTVKK